MRIKVFSIRRDTLVYILLFALGIATRIYFGLSRPTEDLIFYTTLEQYQQTRFGLDKRSGFYPLKIFESVEVRTWIIAILMALLNLAALKRIWGRSGYSVGLLTLIIACSNWYFAQIDMHLVRQQMAVYFFVLMATERRLGFASLVWAGAAVFYHEIALLLIAAWTFAWFVTKYHLVLIRHFVWLASIAALTAMYIELRTPAILFLAYTLLGFLIVKKESAYVSFGDVLALLSLAVMALWMAEVLSPVNVVRTIGVLVSLGLLRLMYDGRFQLKDRQLRVAGLIATLSAYGVVSSV